MLRRAFVSLLDIKIFMRSFFIIVAEGRLHPLNPVTATNFNELNSDCNLQVIILRQGSFLKVRLRLRHLFMLVHLGFLPFLIDLN